jgi:hypothetical protein
LPSFINFELFYSYWHTLKAWMYASICSGSFLTMLEELAAAAISALVR